ncbi:MAG: alpha/beta hydrolase [Planctomycetota bacterium]
MITVYFGTNRRPNRKQNPTDFTGEFSVEGLANLRFGQAEYDSARDVVRSVEVFHETPSGTVLGSAQLMGGLQERMRKNQADALVFIHGFNVSFQDALRSAARLQAAHSTAERPLEVVAFSWPSDGSATHYPSDRHDAKASGLAISRGFEKLIKFLHALDPANACQRKIFLLCHSMGNYALRCAVQEMIKQYRTLPRVFHEIILAAADEDDDTFEVDHKLARLPELADRVTVYFNRGDRALTASDYLKGNPDRLGSNGPRKPRSVHAKVGLVDCTDVVSGLLEHDYYIGAAPVVADIRAVLAGVNSDQVANRDYVVQSNRYRLRG